jgi:uncharacterized protein YhaN
MKLTEINVDQFGIWNDLNLKLAHPGLTVMYGPNETGKSTLMRFLKGMLYGFPSENQEGSISIQQDGNLTSLHRKSYRRRKNQVSLSGYAKNQTPEKFLDSLMGGISEPLFESVYAIGLEEIQKLGTLQKKEVGRHIFGTSLGPEGEALLRMSDDLKQRKLELYNHKNNSGLINCLLDLERQLSQESTKNGTPRKQHEKLSRQLIKLQKETDDLNKRESGMKYQLRGHEFMKRIHEPWKRTNRLERKIKKIPVYPDFPLNSLEKINHIDEERRSLKQERAKLKTGYQGSTKELKKISVKPDLREQLSLMSYFVNSSDWHFQKQNELKSFQSETNSLKDMIRNKFDQSPEEYAQAQTSTGKINPANHVDLMNVAEKYRSTLARRSRLGKRYKSLSKKYNQDLASLEELESILQGNSASETLDITRDYRDDLKHLKKQIEKQDDLTRQRNAFLHQADNFNYDLSLPSWAKGVLIGCVLAGIFFFVWGIFSEREAGWIEGISYALLGITCGCLVWGMKNHFDSATNVSNSKLEEEIQNLQFQLEENQNEIEGLQEDLGHENIPRISRLNFPANLDELEYEIQSVYERIGELEPAEKTEQAIHNVRKRLTQMRNKLKALQTQLGEARQNWCVQLKNSGLEETVSIREGLDQWNVAQEMNLLQNNQRSITEKQRHLEADDTRFRNDVLSLWKKLNPSSLETPPLEKILAGWKAELQKYDGNQTSYQKIYHEYRNQKKSIREINTQIRKLSSERILCLEKAGVRSRPQLERRIKLRNQREELKTQLKEAQRLLETVSKTETEMAIAEEDLKRFNEKENQESIDILTLELEEIVNDFQKAHEEKGSLQKELNELGKNRSYSRLIYQRLQLQKDLKTGLENWTSNQLSTNAGNRLKRHYEKNFQPEVLSYASEYLSQLTGGKYHNIWTQLGENNLCIDDQQNKERHVEELSRGTCEQLFLAVRLATIDQFREKSIQLPLILDDVMVNYDQVRTEAAVETLIQFAEKGHQVILFTCHLHLAELFGKKGLDPLWLHTHQNFQIERKAG